MSWLSDLAASAWKGITSVGKSIADAAAPAVEGIVDTLRRGVEAVQDALKREFREPPATERERIERDLEEVNERIMRLRKRYYERGHLSEADKRENEHLLRQRTELAKELDALDQTATAEEIVKEEDNYQPLEINAELTHILQYHLGQFTFNKNCPVRGCGRAMILQSNRDRPVAGTDDFFWGCIGYYNTRKPCRHRETLRASDLNLFVNFKRREFELAPAELSDIVLEQHTARVRTAMRDVVSRLRRTRQGVDGYRCPIHKERLVLREKRSPDGLLDQFFLGCPRYDDDGHGCNYVVKIKSPAQFSAVFEATGEGGLIHVTGSGSAASTPANHGKHWNDELSEQVARAYDRKLTITQIAEIFQRSPASIYHKLQGMGKLSAEDIDLALGLGDASGSGRRIEH